MGNCGKVILCGWVEVGCIVLKGGDAEALCASVAPVPALRPTMLDLGMVPTEAVLVDASDLNL